MFFKSCQRTLLLLLIASLFSSPQLTANEDRGCCRPERGWWSQNFWLWASTALVAIGAGAAAGYPLGKSQHRHFGNAGPTGPTGSFPTTTGTLQLIFNLTLGEANAPGMVIAFASSPGGHVLQLPVAPFTGDQSNLYVLGPFSPVEIGSYTIGLQVVAGTLLTDAQLTATAIRSSPSSTRTIDFTALVTPIGPGAQWSQELTISGS